MKAPNFALIFSVFYLCFISLPAQSASDTIHHQLDITIQPEKGSIDVVDTISLPESLRSTPFQFMLNDSLALSSPNIRKLETGVVLSSEGITATLYESVAAETLVLRYSGVIQPSVKNSVPDDSPDGQQSTGMISQQGVFLANSSGWYPLNTNHLVTFSLKAHLPDSWQSVTQGERRVVNGTVEWSEENPQDDIFLIAGPFKEFAETRGELTAMVFLRETDQQLADSYIDATFQYVSLYSDLIGDYPYKKFAMVENFWESGYGMPSFTLLGPRVLRFPFILYTSYPHEVLHNWWGNGVYVDYEKGNWAEGLTAYLSDHLFKELRGQGHLYRRDALQKYTDYVSSGKDFSLSEFQSRHSSASEAVGYGKSLMLFHMLRTRFGDEIFKKALSSLYQQYRFKRASFVDIQKVFEDSSGEKLTEFFEQWVRRAGAPQLLLSGQQVTKQGKGGYHLRLSLEQTQAEAAYDVSVPVAVVNDKKETLWRNVRIHQKRQDIVLEFDSKPVFVAVDPWFDVFRRLDGSEIPAALSQGFGAEKVSVILPSKAPKPLYDAYQSLAKQWQASQDGQWQVLSDEQPLPVDGAVWLLGWENRYRPMFAEALDGAAGLRDQELMLEGESFNKNQHSLVLSAHHKSTGQTLLWIGSNETAAIPGLARKLPHYGKYSYLVFTGDAPDNLRKGQWEGMASPLNARLDDSRDVPTITRPQTPLAPLPALFSVGRH